MATKITDTAVETLKRSISENYLEVVIGGIMEQGNLLAEDLTADDRGRREGRAVPGPGSAERLREHDGCLRKAPAAAAACREKDAAALEEAVANINKNLPDGSKLHETAAEIQTQVNAALARVERVLEGLENAIANAPELPSAQQQLRDAAAQLEKAAATLDRWAEDIEMEAPAAAEQARAISAECTRLAAKLQALADKAHRQRPAGGLRRVGEVHPHHGGQDPRDGQGAAPGTGTVTGQVADAMEGVASLSSDAKAMKAAMADTSHALGTTMALLRPATDRMTASLSDTIDGMQDLSADEYMDTLVNILGGDPAVYGQYFPGNGADQRECGVSHRQLRLGHDAVLHGAGHLGGRRDIVVPHQDTRPDGGPDRSRGRRSCISGGICSSS